ncbi:MAG: hypothetical protein EOO88_56400 [Pedobacter sp.]|nr:MAG: hypothetical protein EOO88_56400 [Pedobacter sp.]
MALISFSDYPGQPMDGSINQGFSKFPIDFAKVEPQPSFIKIKVKNLKPFPLNPVLHIALPINFYDNEWNLTLAGRRSQ